MSYIRIPSEVQGKREDAGMKPRYSEEMSAQSDSGCFRVRPISGRKIDLYTSRQNTGHAGRGSSAMAEGTHQGHAGSPAASGQAMATVPLGGGAVDPDQARPIMELSYDKLVYAVGTKTGTFGVKGVEEYCYMLKVIDGWSFLASLFPPFLRRSPPHPLSHTVSSTPRNSAVPPADLQYRRPPIDY